MWHGSAIHRWRRVAVPLEGIEAERGTEKRATLIEIAHGQLTIAPELCGVNPTEWTPGGLLEHCLDSLAGEAPRIR